MPRAFSGEIRTYQIKREKKNKVIYVYQRTEKYNQETKRMEKVDKDVLLGKILPDDPTGTIVPTRPKKKAGANPPRGRTQVSPQSNSDTPNGTASRIRYRGKDILNAIARKNQIDDDIYDILEEGCAQQLLSCARFITCTSNDALSHIATWQLDHPIPYAEGMSEDICRHLTEELGLNETFRQDLFTHRVSHIESDMLIAAYDMVSTCSDNQSDVRYGLKKASDGLKTIKVLALYDSESKSPLGFAKRPGNISDAVSVTNALAQLSVKTARNIILVTGNEFYSEPDAYELITEGLSFLMRIEVSTSWVKKHLDEHYNQVMHSATGCSESGAVVGYTVNTVHPFCKELKDGTVSSIHKRCHLHFYVDMNKRNDIQSALRNRLGDLVEQLENGVQPDEFDKEDQEEIRRFIRSSMVKNKTKYWIDNDSFEEECKYAGIFSLIGFGSFKQVNNTRAAYRTYIKRECIEDHLRAEIQTVDGDTVRSWYGTNDMGRLTIQFVGLIYEESLTNEMNRIKNELEKAIQESDPTGENEILATQQRKLLAWLRRQTAFTLLQWFDAEERADVSMQIRSERFDTETTEQDILFLKMLGVITDL